MCKLSEDKIKSLYAAFRASSGVVTDSRKVVEGAMFFALKGENFDGNRFAAQALESGASCAVVQSGSGTWNGEKYFIVDDVLSALQDLARYHRSQFKIPVISLTGTNGKTTTKELICSVLSSKYKVTATEGNLNNHIGVPLTLLKINPETEIAVIEMGANHPGEIEVLVNIALPDFGMITNVGVAHLEGFGSFEGVKRAKGELYEFLSKNEGQVIYNADNANLSSMLKQYPGVKAMPYGTGFQCAEILPVTFDEPFLRMRIPSDISLGHRGDKCNEESILLKTHLAGDYNADNVMAALNTGLFFGVDTEDAVKAIASYIPSNNRSQLTDTGRNLLVMDAYNANPSSMKASLSNFERSKFENKVLVLGDMLELGKDSMQEHLKVIDQVQKMHFLKCCFVGEEFYKASSEIEGNDKLLFFHDVDELMNMFLSERPQGFTFLVKGSNGINLKEVKEVL